jgi:hypothetical protein
MNAIDVALEAAQGSAFYRVPAALRSPQIERLQAQAVAQARAELRRQVEERQALEKSPAWAAEKKTVAATLAPLVRQHPVYAALALLRGDEPAAMKERR